jgi:nitrous oxidase accessory protein
MAAPLNNYKVACTLFLSLLMAATGFIAPVQARQSLQQRIDAAQAGAIIELAAGQYDGNLIIDKPLSIVANHDAILDGQGHGDVVRVKAADVTLRGLVIRNSGMNLTHMNAGVFAEPTADRLRVEDSRFSDNAFGIWLDACRHPQIINNDIFGTPEVRSQDRGNGIHLYSVQQGLVKANRISQTRDGIYIDSSTSNRLQGNLMQDLRYGVHYMYSYHNEVMDNVTRNTRTGYALMQSKYLTVTGNLSDGDGNYGILMNFITNSDIAHNRVMGTKKGRAFVTGGDDVLGAEGKGLFVYNSQFNSIHENTFENADIGIHLTAGSEDNRIYGNAFLSNRVQVKYVATREQEWSWQGKGNFWSDYLGWDINGDGVGDKPYEPNDAVDKLLWKYPIARVLMSSPTIDTLRWVQKQFPVFKPQGVRDSFPLMIKPTAVAIEPAMEIVHLP